MRSGDAAKRMGHCQMKIGRKRRKSIRRKNEGDAVCLHGDEEKNKRKVYLPVQIELLIMAALAKRMDEM